MTAHALAAPTVIVEGSLIFTFDPSWLVLKYDDTAFYKNHFQNFAGGSKAVDIIAWRAPELWLIEVKDYRAYARTKTIDLFDEVATKVTATLAGLMAVAATNNISDDTDTQTFARLILQHYQQLRVALHLEQPQKPSKVFPLVVDPKNARDALRRKLRFIDHRAIVSGNSTPNQRIQWHVQ
jgi:hypothetical protein